jgi:hypothetical protein
MLLTQKAAENDFCLYEKDLAKLVKNVHVKTVEFEMITPKQFLDFAWPSTRTLTSHGNCPTTLLACGFARPQSLKLKFPGFLNSIKNEISVYVLKFTIMK